LLGNIFNYTAVSDHFITFIPKDKSVPADSVAYVVLNCPGIHKARETWEVAGLSEMVIHAMALPKANGVRRVAQFFSALRRNSAEALFVRLLPY
jgi:hypothetical protein